MELNHILLFIAVAWAVLSILRNDRNVRIHAAIVLAIAAVSWLILRPFAGWISAAFCLFLVLLPNYRAARLRHPARHPIRLTPAVIFFVAANAGMFLIEILAGGPTNAATLYRLGWLDTDAVIFLHEYWRIFTALFLHYGLLHLFFNLFALVILGPGLEREIGTLKFAVCYLVSGLGSSGAVVFLAKIHLLPPIELVGASGCIMGIVGAWAGFLLRNRHAWMAAQRLRNIVVIVIFQFIFDLVTPRVSMSAHLGGLLTGFLLGLMLPSHEIRHTIRSR